MIIADEIIEIGHFIQPHGIKGELNALIEDGVDPEELSCIILDMDGIYVPFFISGIRQRGSLSYLVSIDGINDEHKAASLSNKTIYALRKELSTFNNSVEDEDGFYAEDLIGYTISTIDKRFKGIITEIDDSTDNILFVVSDKKTNKQILIPVADEFITDIDSQNKLITVDLPEGLLTI